MKTRAGRVEVFYNYKNKECLVGGMIKEDTSLGEMSESSRKFALIFGTTMPTKIVPVPWKMMISGW